MQRSKWVIGLMALALVFGAPSAQAQFVKGEAAPAINARDVNGNTVNLNEIVKEGRDLVIQFFFSVRTGEQMALKLATLDMLYGGKELEVIALGFQEDEEALRGFAERLQVTYFIIDDDALGSADWLEKVDSLPLTLFVVTENMTIDKVVRGGSRTKADILKEAAETFFRRRQTAQAAAIAEKALEAGEDPKAIGELKGFNLVAEGKLDEAEKEFGRIDSAAGLAKAALERGDLERAIELADQAGDDGYAQTVKAEALMRSGKYDEAGAALEKAAAQPGAEWKRSETVNAQGRLQHQRGDTAEAVSAYQNAVSLDPYNVVALSNEGAAHREQGNLVEAEAALARAGQIRHDDLAVAMLDQIRRELREANDIKRGELIRSQIADLKARFDEMKAAGTDQPMDPWSTRPVVLAFLPSRSQGPVFFQRAGTDVVIQREIETRLQADSRCSVVERLMLDQLLQELNLGSSELTSPGTQRRLGQVLSAGLLGFMEFVQNGSGATLYLRFVDTETTSITLQASQPVDEKQPTKVVDALIADILENIVGGRELKGLIADASDESAVMINLGRKHGVTEGLEFTVLEDGEPVTVGGRVIAVKQRPVAKLVVRTVEDEYSICEVTRKQDGAVLAKEMKIKGGV